MIHVLFFDDEPLIVTMAARALHCHGIQIDGARNVADFLRMAAAHTHDALLIDWNLRSCEGTNLCQTLRAQGESRPIGIVSGKLDACHGRDLALAVGANAYIEKPFEVDSLAREITMLRRAAPSCQGAPQSKARFACAHSDGSVTTIELRSGDVVLTNLVVHLRAKELAMLEALLKHAGCVLSREELARAVWGLRATPTTSRVETTMSRLRDALGPAATIIETVVGGYVIRAQNV